MDPVGGNTVYTHTAKTPTGTPGIRHEKEEVITEEAYKDFHYYRADPHSRPIFKRRYTFCHAGQEFELDVFSGHLMGLCILELEGSRVGEPVELPFWLSPYREVTEDPAYTNDRLARRDKV